MGTFGDNKTKKLDSFFFEKGKIKQWFLDESNGKWTANENAYNLTWDSIL